MSCNHKDEFTKFITFIKLSSLLRRPMAWPLDYSLVILVSLLLALLRSDDAGTFNDGRALSSDSCAAPGRPRKPSAIQSRLVSGCKAVGKLPIGG